MKNILLIFVPLLIIVNVMSTSNTNISKSLAQNSASTELSQKEKLDDFEYMYNILKENYPYFEVNKRLSNVDWLANKESYIDKIKATKDDYEFYQALQEILSDLHNGHTTLVTKDFYNYIKEVFLSNTTYFKPWLDIINDEKVVRRYSKMEGTINQSTGNSTQYTIINENIRTETIGDGKIAYLAVKSFNLLDEEKDGEKIRNFLNKSKECQALIIDIRGNTGGSELYWQENIVPLLINKPIDNTTYLLYRGGDYTEKMLKDRGLNGYSYCLPISKLDEERLTNLPNEAKEQFKYFAKDQYTINPKDSISFKGNIYLLVNNRVYSSSEAFAVFAKSTGFATLIGETTGGDGIGIDPALCSLPNSGYLFRYSQAMGLTSDGTCNEEFKTQPDIVYNAEKVRPINKDATIQMVLQLEHVK